LFVVSDWFRAQITQCWKSREGADEYKTKFVNHLQIQGRERQELAFRKLFAENNPKSCLMLITDSPAQIGLPNLRLGDRTKENVKKSIVMRLTGYVNISWPNSNNRIKIVMEPSQWYSHDQNYAISLLDQILESEIGDADEYPTLFIHQSDRGPEYNNQGYLMYLSLLLLTGKVKGAILYGRLPAGHR
jgi:hypothetical protein